MPSSAPTHVLVCVHPMQRIWYYSTNSTDGFCLCLLEIFLGHASNMKCIVYCSLFAAVENLWLFSDSPAVRIRELSEQLSDVGYILLSKKKVSAFSATLIKEEIRNHVPYLCRRKQRRDRMFQKQIGYRGRRMEARYNISVFAFNRIKIHFHVFKINQNGACMNIFLNSLLQCSRIQNMSEYYLQ